MTRNFEVYVHTKPVEPPPPTMKITRGRIELNGPAVAAIGAPDYVELLYDATTRAVGVRPADDPEGPTALRLAVARSTDGTRLVDARGFLSFIGEDVLPDSALPVTVEDGAVWADLNRADAPTGATA